MILEANAPDSGFQGRAIFLDLPRSIRKCGTRSGVLKVNAQDVRGMTPLMLAIATDRANPETVKLLLAKGGDPAIKDKNGESAIDWARKFQYPPVLAALGVEQARNWAPAAMVAAAESKPVLSAIAVERGLVVLQRTNAGFLNEGGCFACHAQNLAGIVVNAARANGFKVDKAVAAGLARGVRIGWSAFEQPLLQRMD